MPKVSVIIPVYNVEKYLRQCLESIVNQTLNDIEVICVNDGSSDLSLDILNEYQARDNPSIENLQAFERFLYVDCEKYHKKYERIR